ncbi:MAG: glycosyltransferase family 8 protein [Candidatus Altimarinota bacterium]
MEKINICFCIDDKYIKHTFATISSIIENSAKKSDIIFYIISDSISNENKQKINNLSEKKNIIINIIEINEAYDENISLGKYGKYILYRLSIPEYINEDKILYLDSDMIILGKIEELWKKNISNYIVGVIQQDKPKNFPLDIKYFNSGLLLINAVLWKKENIKSKVLNYLSQNNHFGWPDQDALNMVIKGNCLFLDKSWNTLNFYSTSKVNLFHFAGLKPWRIESLNPYNLEYYKYLSMTMDLSTKDKKIYLWNKFLKIIPLSIKIFIDKYIYLNLYYIKEYFLKK